MKNYIKVIFAVAILNLSVNSIAQTLGTYPNTTVVAGQNTTNTPDVAPTNTSSVVAYTNTNFTGLLSVNPTTGVVTITNAKQAGVYTVTVKAFGAVTTTATFSLTVTNPGCSQGFFNYFSGISVGSTLRSVIVGEFNGDGKQDIALLRYNTVSIRLGDGLGGFSGTTEVGVGTNSYSIAVGDFNGDGRQDIATASYSSNSVSIRLGDGMGGFSGITSISVGTNPKSIAVADFNGDGKQDFVTANFGSKNVSIRLGDGTGGFSGNTDISVGANPYSVAVGEFNGDGKQDFAVTIPPSSVSVFKGDGAGGFTLSTTESVGSFPNGIAVSDFNGDGRQDFATANNGGNTVSIRFGTGSGGFGFNTNIVVGYDPVSVHVADFNGDGKQDIAACKEGSQTISIRFGDGVGGFSGTNEIWVGGGEYSGTDFIAVGNFNGDGIHDIATTNGDNSVSIQLGGAAEINVQGNGVSIADGDYSSSAADHTLFGIVTGVGNEIVRTFTVQNTGATDLHISGITSSNLSFSVGGFLPLNPVGPGNSITFTVSFSPTTEGFQNARIIINNDDCNEAVYDFYVRGKGEGILPPTLGSYLNTTIQTGQNISISPDIFPANIKSIAAYTNPNFTGLLSVSRTTGVVTVTNAKHAGVYPVTIKAFGATNISTNFLLTVTNPNCSKGLFSATSNISIGINPSGMAVGDFNGDGRQDLAAIIKGNLVAIRLGDGAGGLSGTTNLEVGNKPLSVAVGDFNGDGKQDIAVANYSSNSLSIRLGDGFGGFIMANDISFGSYTRSIAIGDFNGDGWQDIAATVGSKSVAICFGNGAGGFAGTTEVAVGNSPYCVAVGDFNGDGKGDIVSANYYSNTVSLRLGDGIGGFTGATELDVGTNPRCIAVGDFNGDGKQDFATANYSSNFISVRFGNGVGGFMGGVNLNVGTSTYSIAIGDFNGDGRQDIAASNYVSNKVFVRYANAQGGFSGNTNISVGNSPDGVVVGDFNGDGMQDIATANFNGNTVSICKGGGADINLQGNSIDIANGDINPDINDFTDFGNINSGFSSTHTFIIQNRGTLALAISSISSDNPLFVVSPVSGTIPAGGSATFTATFSPISPGLQQAAISVNSDDCDETVYEFLVMGMGIGEITFTWYKDEDDDGYSDGTTLIQGPQPVGYKLAGELIATSGDCNDANASVHPGAPEICDGIDNNCDGVGDEGVVVTWYKDADNDSYSDGTTLRQCLKPTNYKSAANLLGTSGDCNDGNANINPGTTELCDGIDNNCNGQTDEGVIGTWFKDADNDGYSNGMTLTQCSQPTGYKLAANLLAISGDCSDGEATIYPGAVELCDGLDNNCDTQIDEDCPPGTPWYLDYDLDGYGNPNKRVISITQPFHYVGNNLDCNDDDPTRHAGAAELEDGIDNDCDGEVDEGLACRKLWYLDGDGDGFGRNITTRWSCVKPNAYVAIGGDCNDQNAVIYPGAPELEDGRDNNCNGVVDEGLSCRAIWYVDRDNDGFGSPSLTKWSCPQPTGFVTNSSDCNDFLASAFPGAPELCDGWDNNCDGLVDNGLAGTKIWYADNDGDGYGRRYVSKVSCLQPPGFVALSNDCNDENKYIYPGAPEICDGKDNDCDGQRDEGCIRQYVTEEQKPANTTKPLAKAASPGLEVSIWPNPARDVLMVSLDAFEPGKKLEMVLMQVDGRAVASQSLIPAVKGQQVSFDVRAMSAGYYLLQVKQGGLSQVKRVVIAM